VAEACAALSKLPDRDSTARVSLRPMGEDLLLVATLEDGRTATRRVRAASSLATTLEALLAVPSAPPAPRAVDPAEPPDLKPRTPAATAPGVELAISIGGRVSLTGPYWAASLGGLLQVHVEHWLLGAGMRWDALQVVHTPTPPGFESAAVAVALTAGRRLDLNVGAVDLGVSPRLVSQIQTAQLAGGERTGSDTDVRVGVFARSTFGRTGARLLVEADMEISPVRVRREVRIQPEFPELPAWSAGVAAGVLWGAP
jgi:hypothetical protein